MGNIQHAIPSTFTYLASFTMHWQAAANFSSKSPQGQLATGVLEDSLRCKNITGRTPSNTMNIAALDASARRSSLARRYTWVARVLKLKGLRMSVAGSSRMTSTNTNKHAANTLGFKRGK